MPGKYRPEDFDDDSDGVGVIAMFVAALYGVIMGSAGTLFVQWLIA